MATTEQARSLSVPVPAEIARVSRGILQLADLITARATAVLGPAGLTLSRWFVLRELVERPGCTAAELAGILSLSKARLSAVVEELVEAGLVRRERRPDDRRRLHLSLTEEGRRLTVELVPRLGEAVGRAYSALSAEEFAGLRAGVTALAEELATPPARVEE
ncbi:MAG: MarR family transcriptional regulator [Kineosporiaceae bacterium]